MSDAAPGRPDLASTAQAIRQHLGSLRALAADAEQAGDPQATAAVDRLVQTSCENAVLQLAAVVLEAPPAGTGGSGSASGSGSAARSELRLVASALVGDHTSLPPSRTAPLLGLGAGERIRLSIDRVLDLLDALTAPAARGKMH